MVIAKTARAHERWLQEEKILKLWCIIIVLSWHHSSAYVKKLLALELSSDKREVPGLCPWTRGHQIKYVIQDQSCLDKKEIDKMQVPDILRSKFP